MGGFNSLMLVTQSDLGSLLDSFLCFNRIVIKIHKLRFAEVFKTYTTGLSPCLTELLSRLFLNCLKKCPFFCFPISYSIFVAHWVKDDYSFLLKGNLVKIRNCPAAVSFI